MEAARLPMGFTHTPPANPPADRDDEYAWVYDDPDLAPFRARARSRAEVPLTAFE